MQPGAPTASAEALLDAFRRQQHWCQDGSPFSTRVLQCTVAWLQTEPGALRALCQLAADPWAAALPLRWLAALHELALGGLQPWAGLWPSTAPAPNAARARPLGAELDAALDAALVQAWQQQRPSLQVVLSRPPQTNEVQRSAALLPGLLHVAQRTGLPLSLLELGASAGLNLWCDHYRHEHTQWAWLQASPALVLRSDWQGPPPPMLARLQVLRRAACDTNPIDLDDPQQARLLTAYVWADQAERLQRLRLAMQVAGACMAQTGVRVQTSRAADFLRLQLRALQPGQVTVLMHSVVWQYLPAAEQADILAQVQAAGARATAAAPLAWLRFEPPHPEQGVELRCRIWPGIEADRLLARCHPHGQRIEWLE